MFTLLRLLLSPMMLPVMIFAAGFILFKQSEPVCEPISSNANMFVLTGDARRIPFAIQKLEGHPKRKLYVIGAGTPVIESEYKKQIEIENVSKNTYENAVAIKNIVHKKGMWEITLITTSDHINRSVLLVKRELPLVKINACPVPLTNMESPQRLERWLNEYIKFIGTLIGISGRG